MQNEFNNENPTLNIQILGMNQAGYTSGNGLVTQLGDVPWLQDTVDENAWGAWAPVYRDVIIVDENNQRVGVYNLTTHNLATASDFQDLKSIILAEAED